MTPLRLLCGLVVVALSVGGCTEPEAPPQSLVIGVLAPTSGGDAPVGKDAVSGAALAVEIVNGSHPDLSMPFAAERGLPGLRDAKLRLVERDSKGKVDVALSQASELVEGERAAAVVLADSAEISAATASQLQRLRTPMIDALANADYLAELGLDWYFRIAPTERAFVESSLGLVRRQIDHSGQARIAIFAQADPSSPTVMTQIRQTVVAVGARVVTQTQLSDDGSVPWEATSPPTAPDALFAYAHTSGGAQQLLEVAEKVRGDPPVFGLGPGFAKLDRRKADDGLLRPMPWSAEYAERSPTGRAVQQLYKKRFGRSMTQVAAHAFTATVAVAVAMNTAGSTDPATIRSTLRQTTLPPAQMIMPWDGLRFSPDGQNLLAAVVIEQWRGNAFHLVYPSELASRPVDWDRSEPGA